MTDDQSPLINEQIEIDLAPLIDLTFLNPVALPEQIKFCCDQAQRYQFAGVCVYPSYVPLATEQLHGQSPKVGTVIGFPSGATTAAVKLYEALEAVEQGATVLDVVVNLSWIKLGQTQKLHREMAEICQETGQTVKAILETPVLTDAEKALATEVLMDAGISGIQTSTGWYGGATVEDVRLLKQLTQSQIAIKASGRIQTYQQAADLVLAGANSLGTSYGIEIVRQQNQDEESS